MTTPAHAADLTAPSGLLKALVDEEPALAGAAAGWLLSDVGDLAVHYHLTGPVQWSATTQVLLPPVTGVILFIIGWLVRSVVASPKTQRILQDALAAARAHAQQAAQPIVVQVDGKTIATAVASAPPLSEPTPLDGLPPVLPPTTAVVEAPAT